MRSKITLACLAVIALGTSAGAITVEEILAQAQANGTCGDLLAIDVIQRSDGIYEIICGEDATAFAPIALIGGLAPVAGIGAAALLASAVGATSSTTSTSGTLLPSGR
ncbi:MAG: hypothetical protein JKX69_13725 [Rhodobacteraceae bacterium]|nr:hypothetical protein [Paracoccaceae bacterium]